MHFYRQLWTSLFAVFMATSSHIYSKNNTEQPLCYLTIRDRWPSIWVSPGETLLIDQEREAYPVQLSDYEHWAIDSGPLVLSGGSLHALSSSTINKALILIDHNQLLIDESANLDWRGSWSGHGSIEIHGRGSIQFHEFDCPSEIISIQLIDSCAKLSEQASLKAPAFSLNNSSLILPPNAPFSSPLYLQDNNLLYLEEDGAQLSSAIQGSGSLYIFAPDCQYSLGCSGQWQHSGDTVVQQCQMLVQKDLEISAQSLLYVDQDGSIAFESRPEPVTIYQNHITESGLIEQGNQAIILQMNTDSYFAGRWRGNADLAKRGEGLWTFDGNASESFGRWSLEEGKIYWEKGAFGGHLYVDNNALLIVHEGSYNKLEISGPTLISNNPSRATITTNELELNDESILLFLASSVQTGIVAHNRAQLGGTLIIDLPEKAKQAHFTLVEAPFIEGEFSYITTNYPTLLLSLEKSQKNVSGAIMSLPVAVSELSSDSLFSAQLLCGASAAFYSQENRLKANLLRDKANPFQENLKTLSPRLISSSPLFTLNALEQVGSSSIDSLRHGDKARRQSKYGSIFSGNFIQENDHDSWSPAFYGTSLGSRINVSPHSAVALQAGIMDIHSQGLSGEEKGIQSLHFFGSNLLFERHRFSLAIFSSLSRQIYRTHRKFKSHRDSFSGKGTGYTAFGIASLLYSIPIPIYKKNLYLEPEIEVESMVNMILGIEEKNSEKILGWRIDPRRVLLTRSKMGLHLVYRWQSDYASHGFADLFSGLTRTDWLEGKTSWFGYCDSKKEFAIPYAQEPYSQPLLCVRLGFVHQKSKLELGYRHLFGAPIGFNQIQGSFFLSF